MSGEALNVGGVGEGSPEAAIEFTALAEPPGLEIRDRIERRQCRLLTPRPPTPEPAEPVAFRAPVDAAVRLTTDRLRLPHREVVHVHDPQGEPVTHAFDTERSCPHGRYVLSLTTAVKLYLRVEAPLRITPGDDGTEIDLGGETEVLVGARSPHRRPAGTVTTTADLDDLRAAVAAFPSALKTTRPERSFPTLRGHPPLLELGDELRVPDHLVPPETGITLEVERSLADLYAAAPLAFYLGADLEWGERRLRTDRGGSFDLTAAGGVETGIERALKQCFTLDCLTRTEGLYPVDLDERRRFEAAGYDLDLAALHGAPPAERLEAYLEVPWSAVEPLVPTWSQTAYVDPTPERAPYLPYLLDSLSAVRTSGQRPIEEVTAPTGPGRTRRYSLMRGATAEGATQTRRHLVLPEDPGSLARTWVGDGAPVGGSKAVLAGYEHRLEREPVDGDIRLLVVCNEPEMREERDSVEAVYGSRADVDLDVTIRSDVSTGELRTLLERDTEFLHFIGHVDAEGFRCGDGWLDAATCETVGADAFLLNSCRSYEQGERLVEGGSVGGIVTLTDLLNHRAAEIGQTMARFLNAGFPLYVALEVVREAFQFGKAYTLLGDGQAMLSQPTTTAPEYLEIVDRDSEIVTGSHQTFHSSWVGLGAELSLPYGDGERHHLLGGEVGQFELDPSVLEEVLASPMPLRDGKTLRFSLPELD